MANVRTISPLTATLICINSMIGAGLFINPKPLTMLAGAYGFLGYIIAAIILFPLIISVAELAALHPVAGGLYMYTHKHIGPWAGFIGGWSYFVGKTTSAVVLVHKFVQFFQARISVIGDTPILLLDVGVIFLLAGLNTIGVSIGGRVQYFFTALKATPVLFAFGIGFFYFDAVGFTDLIELQNLMYTVPIAIFTLLGFEVICSVGNQVQDAAQNLRRIILTAFFIVAVVNILFQLVSFGVLGYELAEVKEPLWVMANKFFGDYPVVASLLNGFVFASILGASFSLLTSNCWNLQTMARFGHLPGGQLLMKINANQVPWVSLCVEVILGCFILYVTLDQVPLQNMAVFAQVVAHFMSALAAWYAVKSGALTRLAWWVPLLAIVGSSIILSISLYRIILFGVSFSFLFLLLAGVVAALGKKLFVK